MTCLLLVVSYVSFVCTEKVTYSNLGPLFHNAIIRQVLFLSIEPFSSDLFAHFRSSAGAHAGR